MMYSFRSQHIYEAPMHVDSDTIGAMLPKLGEYVITIYKVLFMQNIEPIVVNFYPQVTNVKLKLAFPILPLSMYIWNS